MSGLVNIKWLIALVVVIAATTFLLRLSTDRLAHDSDCSEIRGSLAIRTAEGKITRVLFSASPVECNFRYTISNDESDFMKNASRSSYSGQRASELYRSAVALFQTLQSVPETNQERENSMGIITMQRQAEACDHELFPDANPKLLAAIRLFLKQASIPVEGW